MALQQIAVPGKAFGGGQAAIGLQVVQLRHFRQRNACNVGAGALQLRQGALEHL